MTMTHKVTWFDVDADQDRVVFADAANAYAMARVMDFSPAAQNVRVQFMNDDQDA